MRRNDLRPRGIAWLIGRVALTLLFRLYLRLRVEGEELVPSEGAFLIVCNHLSNLDPLAIGFACHRQINFLAKQEVFKIPIASFFVREWGAIPFDRASSDPGAVRAALRVLRQGKILGIFPEGTRSANGQLQPFHEGAAKLALRFAVPIIPVAIKGTNAAMPRGAIFIRPARVTVRFGAPFAFTTGQSSGSPLSEASAEMRGRIARLLEEV